MFTIGYEGRSLDDFLDVLAENKIEHLCDVRKNAISRKKGFSKTALTEALNAELIRYSHLPVFGIPSDERKAASGSKSLHLAMLDAYERKIVADSCLVKSLAWIANKSRIALMCYEKDPHMCHRGRIASVLKKSANIKIKHL